MDKKFLFWHSPAEAIVWIVLLLMGIGAINVFSASYVQAGINMHNPYYFLIRYVIFGIVGLALFFWLGYRVNYKRLMTPRALGLMAVVGVLSLLAVFAAGEVVNGARRWIRIPGVGSFQPSEMVKLLEVIIGSHYLGERMRQGLNATFRDKDCLILMGYSGLLGLFVFMQPDMGTATIIWGLMMGLFFMAGLPWAETGVVALVGGLGLITLAKMAPYRMARLTQWLDPWKDAQGTGYQTVQSLLAIGSGGFSGMTWGQGTGKFFYLPEAHTDFAFAIFCQEWGFIGVLLMVACFFLLLWALVLIMWNTRNPRGFLLVGGVTMLVVGQSAANMLMVSGCAPVIGVPLVFISYGGTSMVTNLVGLGLVLSVYRDEQRKREIVERYKAGLPPVEKPGLRVVRRNGGRRPLR